MHYSSESVEALVEQFMKLPTVGRKTAQRLVSYVLKMPRTEVVEIANALIAVKDRIKECSVCHNVTDNDPCPICSSSRRDHSVICVVEDANDVMALERTHEFRGVYHVLGGVISPLDGVGPEDLNVRQLVARIDPAFRKVSSENGSRHAAGLPPSRGDSAPEVDDSGRSIAEGSADYDFSTPISEVILALNPTVEGDTTAYYISQILKSHDVRLTRIARGLPIGGDLEYADEATLSRALEGRSTI